MNGSINYILPAILAVILIVAVYFSVKHFKGNGGCCGGGGEIREKPNKLTAPKVAEKTVYINGMHCENCQNRVQRKLNSIDGASARVNLKKKLAVVEMSREISDEELTEAVKNAGYEFEKIERKD